MKKGGWLIWIVFIVVIIIIFPKPCGYKNTSSNEADISNENQEQLQGSAELYDDSAEDQYLENDSSYDEYAADQYVEDNFTEDPGITRNSVQDTDTVYRCMGIIDSLISKLNKNNSVQFCYGVCLYKNADYASENENQSISDYPTDYLGGMMKDFSKAFVILISIGILIIFITMISNILNKSKNS